MFIEQGVEMYVYVHLNQWLPKVEWNLKTQWVMELIVFPGGHQPPYIIDLTQRVERCVTQKCCNNNIIKLRDNISCEMAKYPCKIASMKVIGKSTLKLEKDYLKLSNMLYVIDSTNQSCDVYDTINCLYKKL